MGSPRDARDACRRLAALLALAATGVALLGCTSTTAAPASAAVPSTVASPGPGGTPTVVGTPSPIPLSSRPVIEVRAGGRALRVAVADDEASWEQGLQGVTELGSLDGMLFRFHATGSRAFWMKDTLLPLDVAFFDASGDFVSVTTMPLCRADPCPTYLAAAPFATALEARAGSLGFLRAGDRLVMEAAASASR